MKIRVIRDYSGEEGTDVDKNVFAGSEHHVSRARGAQLFASGLVEIVEDEDDDADGPIPAPADPADEAKGDVGGEKIAPITANKAAPAVDNKAAPAAKKRGA